MKKPKTIKGYLSYLKKVISINVVFLKGYEELSDSEKLVIGSILADIENGVSEFENNN